MSTDGKPRMPDFLPKKTMLALTEYPFHGTTIRKLLCNALTHRIDECEMFMKGINYYKSDDAALELSDLSSNPT